MPFPTPSCPRCESSLCPASLCCICYPPVSYLVSSWLSDQLLWYCSDYVRLTLILLMAPKHTSSDAGSLDMVKRSYKVLFLSERYVCVGKNMVGRISSICAIRCLLGMLQCTPCRWGHCVSMNVHSGRTFHLENKR